MPLYQTSHWHTLVRCPTSRPEVAVCCKHSAVLRLRLSCVAPSLSKCLCFLLYFCLVSRWWRAIASIWLSETAVTTPQPSMMLHKAWPKAIVFISPASPRRHLSSPLLRSVLWLCSFLLTFSFLLPSGLPLAFCDAARGWGQNSGTWPPLPFPPLLSPLLTPLPCPPNPSWAHYDIAPLPLSKPELSELITG